MITEKDTGASIFAVQEEMGVGFINILLAGATL